MAYDWVKLWIEMLDDRKTASLPDSLWRRFVECILLAAEVNEGGILPPVNDMAWRLRVDTDTMGSDLSRLALSGLTELLDDGVWKVTNFAKRQSFIPVKERVASHRARQKKAAVSNAGETQSERDSNEHVTNRYTDKIRIDKNRSDERDSAAAAVTKPSQSVTSRYTPPEPSMTANLHPAVKAIQQVTTFWPGEITHPVIIEKLGDNPDIGALGRAYQLWVSRGYNPRNYDGLGEWYQEIVRDPNWQPPNGKNGIRQPAAPVGKPMKEIAPGVY